MRSGRGTRRAGTQVLWGALLLTVAVAASGYAKERVRKVREPDVDRPLLIVNVASVERLLNQAVFAFEEGGRPELAETLGAGLAKINDLKGIDRRQSMGVMVFLSKGIVPVPENVAYVPVKNIDELLKTLEIGPLTTKKVGDNQYEIVSGTRKWQVLVRRDYAFVAETREALDHDLGDPAAFSSKLAKAFDIGAVLDLTSLTQTTRDIFAGTFRAKAESDLQRRDNEPVAAHRMRRAVGMQRLEFLEQLLAQGEQVTLGWRTSQDEKSSALELQVSAKPGSEFANTFNELRGTRTHFANLLSGRPPLTVAASLKLDKSNRKLWKELFTGMELRLLERLSIAADSTSEPAPSVRELSKTLQAAIESGHLDAVVQFVGKPPGPFVLVGGMRVNDSIQAANALRGIFQGLPGTKLAPETQLSAFTHKGIEFHRLQIQQNEESLYGGKPSFYFGAGESVVWFAVGCDEATAELKKAIDRVSEPIREASAATPFQIAVNLSDWFEIIDPRKRMSLARQALTDSKDTLRVDLQGTSDGAKLRIRFDEGFIRLVGMGLAKSAEQWRTKLDAEAAPKPSEKAPEADGAEKK